MEEKKHILVVEDEAVTSKLVESILQTNGYEVSVVSNGLEALSKIKTKVPDLIISDVIMPEMDGFTFYKELKKDPAAQNVPVIILTARSKMGETFSVLGADEFLAKPFTHEDFLNKVAVLIARERPKSIDVPSEIRDFSVLTKKREALPIGHIMFGIFIFVALVIVYFLFRQFTTTRQEAIKIGEERKLEQLIP